MKHVLVLSRKIYVVGEVEGRKEKWNIEDPKVKISTRKYTSWEKSIFDHFKNNADIQRAKNVHHKKS